MPQRHKITLFPNSTFQTDPDEIDYQWFPFIYVIVTPNVFNTIALAIRRNNYPLAVLFTWVCVGFFLLQLYVSKMLNKNWIGKIWVNLNMWFLHTFLPFGAIYQLSDFLTPLFTLIMYIVVLLSSLFMFYLFVMDDLVKCWKIWRNREDDHWMQENQSNLGDRNLNNNSVSICEKV